MNVLTENDLEVELSDFLLDVDVIYGLYLDANAGFIQFHRMVISNQEKMCVELGMPIEELDARPFSYVENETARDNAQWEHSTTQGELKNRNKKNGENSKNMANFCLVLIYQYWEYHRQKLKDRTGILINSELLGENIRHIRHSILKNKGRGNKDMEKAKTISWCKKGEMIYFSQDQFRWVVEKIKEEIYEMQKKYFCISED